MHKDEVEHVPYGNPEKFDEYFSLISNPIDGSNNGYMPGDVYRELQRVSNAKTLKSTAATAPWVQRGPGNVGGRTRAILIDPADTTGRTWLVGSASGGIWKTNNNGQSWVNQTPNLPILSTTTLARSKDSSSVIYAGTGEGFSGFGMVSGAGIFKSIQNGDKNTWQLLDTTASNDDFMFVNRIVVDHESPDTLLCATNVGIFKSEDGGNSWRMVYELPGHRVQDLVSHPDDFNILFAAVNRFGIIKSEDKGETWVVKNNGILEGRRYEIAISPVDAERMYVGAEGFGGRTMIYQSFNGGEDWHLFQEQSGKSVNFHGGQGWFNNTLAGHPFDEDILYVGGVEMGRIEFSRATEQSDYKVLRVDTVGVAHFMLFNSFGGEYFGGALATGEREDAEEIELEDYVSVSIKFGPGRKQMLHRFVVPEGSGAGVPNDEYTYADYVEVPFEIWDTENNIQLMGSFRDNERDTVFNLLEFDDDKSELAREYIFVNNIEYDAQSPDQNIVNNEAGHIYKMMYFMWPVLWADSTWTPDDLPNSSVDITFGRHVFQNGDATVLADYVKNDNLHVDHHEIVTYITDEEDEKFNLIVANDGGLGISSDGGNTWEQLDEGYTTTQLYGVAKYPGRNEYIGGMQDNGTWMSAKDEDADLSTIYEDQLEGDGFEVLWHPSYPQRLIGSSQFNGFSVTNNFGEDWDRANDGVLGDGPFFSRLSHSRQNPDIIYAVGGEGVYRHNNFGLGKFSWQLNPVNEKFGWTLNDVALTHDIEVSRADKDVILAGTGLSSELYLFASNDGGETYTKVFWLVPNLFHGLKENLGFISSIKSHPTNPNIFYVLMSVKEQPKVLRITLDFDAPLRFGSWLDATVEDISGFGMSKESSKAFPDVRTHSLWHFEHAPEKIWVGTEIGIMESDDNGSTWNLLNNGFPAVSVMDIFVQDDQVVVATHGRGIWTLDITEVSVAALNQEEGLSWDVYPNPAYDQINFSIPTLNIPAVIQLMDIQGKIVLERSIDGFEVKGVLDVSTISSGTYLMRIQSTETYQTKRVVVQ